MNQTNRQDSEQPLVDLAMLVWRRRRGALLIAGVLACAVLVAFNFVPRRYAATATFERRGDSIAARTDSRIPESYRSLKPVMKFELTGAPAIERALADLGRLDGLPHDNAGQLTPEAQSQLSVAVARLQENLDIQWIVNSENVDRVSLTFTTTDPSLAHALPNRLVENYIRRTRDELCDQLTRSAGFMGEQLDAAQAKLADLRAQRGAFELAHPDMLPGSPLYGLTRLERIDGDLGELSRRRKDAAGLLANLESRDGAEDRQVAGEPVFEPNPAYPAAVARVNELRRQIDAARTSGQMTERHPRVVALVEALAQAEAELADTPSQLSRPGPMRTIPADEVLVTQIDQLRRDVESLDDQIASLQQQRAELDALQANAMPVLAEYQRLSGQIEDAEGEVTSWRDNLKDVQMALDAERSGARTNLAVVRLAGPAHRPSWPPLWLVFGLAVGGGLVGAIALTVLASRLARSFQSPDEARQVLGLPVLATVGPILSPVTRRVRIMQRWVLQPLMVLLLIGVTGLAAAGVVLLNEAPTEHTRILKQVHPLGQEPNGPSLAGL